MVHHIHRDAVADGGLVADELVELRLEGVGEGVVEGGERHAPGTRAHQKHGAVEGDDGLASAGGAGHTCGTTEATLGIRMVEAGFGGNRCRTGTRRHPVANSRSASAAIARPVRRDLEQPVLLDIAHIYEPIGRHAV